jgi:hypothetical protein
MDKIHYTYRVIAQFSNKQALVRHIDSQVINSAPHLAQRNLGL